jgi:hypothetical protein
MDGSGNTRRTVANRRRAPPALRCTKHDMTKPKMKRRPWRSLPRGKNQLGRQRLGRAMARWVLRAWAAARSGDLPVPRTHWKYSPWSPQDPPALRFFGKWRRLKISLALGFCMHLRVVDKIEDVGATFYRGFDH